MTDPDRCMLDAWAMRYGLASDDVDYVLSQAFGSRAQSVTTDEAREAIVRFVNARDEARTARAAEVIIWARALIRAWDALPTQIHQECEPLLGALADPIEELRRALRFLDMAQGKSER